MTIILLGAGYNPFCGYSIIPPLYISLPEAFSLLLVKKNIVRILTFIA